jgi:predicted DNA-binding transcriptional regulator YafY
MSNQATLFRTLEMIRLLSRAGGVSIKTLAEEYEVSERTIQRTIDAIRLAGYEVDYSYGRYRINKSMTREYNRFDMNDLLHFTREEAWMLNTAIDSLNDMHPVKENLKKKLNSTIDEHGSTGSLFNEKNFGAIQVIYKAIQNKTQVILEEYAFVSAGRYLKQIVAEPIDFAIDFNRVWVYLPTLKKNVLLRISGLAGIKATGTTHSQSKIPQKRDD